MYLLCDLQNIKIVIAPITRLAILVNKQFRPIYVVIASLTQLRAIGGTCSVAVFTTTHGETVHELAFRTRTVYTGTFVNEDQKGRLTRN